MHWKNYFYILFLPVLITACEGSDIAKGTPISNMYIIGTIRVLSDSAPYTDNTTEIRLSIYKGCCDNVRLSQGGTVTAHANGIAYVFDLTEIPPLPPYSYETKFRYSALLPIFADNTEIRIALNRPGEEDAPNTTVTIPAKPVILTPIDNSTIFRTDDVYVSWLAESYNDRIEGRLSACSTAAGTQFTSDDTGDYTFLSSVFLPYASDCSGGVSITRIRQGMPDSGLSIRSTISINRRSSVGLTISP